MVHNLYLNKCLISTDKKHIHRFNYYKIRIPNQDAHIRNPDVVPQKGCRFRIKIKSIEKLQKITKYHIRV